MRPGHGYRKWLTDGATRARADLGHRYFLLVLHDIGKRSALALEDAGLALLGDITRRPVNLESQSSLVMGLSMKSTLPLTEAAEIRRLDLRLCRRVAYRKMRDSTQDVILAARVETYAITLHALRCANDDAICSTSTRLWVARVPTLAVGT
ncbi:hypothetical protein K470DRAFT_255170 [Piedraia hortae CBS 480.64]|uniref:Uncharacterized protein n=1 Tax=Piedraia hortae CBS 480.64 TaxID=1314780 RepID=A0A6A7C7J8_9PEZI|nr:hypothetical protein K470DRAFT_255170 [Piedraia hortae CBS 480.64]